MYLVPRGRVIFSFTLPLELTTGNPLIPFAEIGNTTTSPLPWYTNVRKVSLIAVLGSFTTIGVLPVVIFGALPRGSTRKLH